LLSQQLMHVNIDSNYQRVLKLWQLVTFIILDFGLRRYDVKRFFQMKSLTLNSVLLFFNFAWFKLIALMINKNSLEG
jgi:hypothetical protein